MFIGLWDHFSGSYDVIGMGKIFEKKAEPYREGLEFRAGLSKGVRIIINDNGQLPVPALVADGDLDLPTTTNHGLCFSQEVGVLQSAAARPDRQRVQREPLGGLEKVHALLPRSALLPVLRAVALSGHCWTHGRSRRGHFVSFFVPQLRMDFVILFVTHV